MKLALYQNDYGRVICEEWAENASDYIRLSDFIEIDFPMLDKGVITAAQVTQLDKQLDALMSKVQEIRARKQELLALSHEHE